MTGQKFVDYIRYLARTNATTFSNADVVMLANIAKDDIAKEIIKADEDYFGVPVTTNLRATSTSDFSLREYKLPDDNMKVIRVEAKLDGTNWVKLTKFDLTQWTRPTTDSEVTDKFANAEGEAFWDKFRNSIWLYTGTISDAVTAGLKMWHIAYPADITTSTLSDDTSDLSEDPTSTSAGMPRQFHELWARRVAIVWKQSREKPIPLTEREAAWEFDLAKALASIDSIDSEPLLGVLPDDSKLQY